MSKIARLSCGRLLSFLPPHLMSAGHVPALSFPGRF